MWCPPDASPTCPFPTACRRGSGILARITPSRRSARSPGSKKIQDFLEAHDAEGLVVARLSRGRGDQGRGPPDGFASRSRNGSPLRTRGMKCQFEAFGVVRNRTTSAASLSFERLWRNFLGASTRPFSRGFLRPRPERQNGPIVAAATSGNGESNARVVHDEISDLDFGFGI